MLANTTPIKPIDFGNGRQRPGVVVDNEAGDSLIDDFRNRVVAINDHKCPASHCFDHDEPEGFGPMNRNSKQRARGPAKRVQPAGVKS